jgi:hypothetical protein
MEKSGQLVTQATLPREKELPIPIGEEAGCVTEPKWTTWRREKSRPYRDSNSDHTAVQPVASRYADCAGKWKSGFLLYLITLLDCLSYITSIGKMIVNWKVDVEGSDRGLFQKSFPMFAWRDGSCFC